MTTQTTIPEVRKAHRLAIQTCLAKLAQIEAEVKNGRGVKNPDWGYVGSLNKISSDLDEIMKFLGLISE